MKNTYTYKLTTGELNVKDSKKLAEKLSASYEILISMTPEYEMGLFGYKVPSAALTFYRNLWLHITAFRDCRRRSYRKQQNLIKAIELAEKHGLIIY